MSDKKPYCQECERLGMALGSSGAPPVFKVEYPCVHIRLAESQEALRVAREVAESLLRSYATRRRVHVGEGPVCGQIGVEEYDRYWHALYPRTEPATGVDAGEMK